MQVCIPNEQLPLKYGINEKNKNFYFYNTVIYVIIYLFLFYYFLSSPEDMLIDFRKRGREGEREGEKRLCERETLIDSLLHVLQLGIEPAT